MSSPKRCDEGNIYLFKTSIGHVLNGGGETKRKTRGKGNKVAFETA